jgi:hypothetical protein
MNCRPPPSRRRISGEGQRRNIIGHRHRDKTMAAAGVSDVDGWHRKGACICDDVNGLDGPHLIPHSTDVVNRSRSAMGKLGEHLVQVLIVRRRERVVVRAAVGGLIAGVTGRDVVAVAPACGVLDSFLNGVKGKRRAFVWSLQTSIQVSAVPRKTAAGSRPAWSGSALR